VAFEATTMPVHDWTRVEAGVFHHLHNAWITFLSDALNAGLLPSDYYALGEQRSGDFGPDVLTLQIDETAGLPPESGSQQPDTNDAGGMQTLLESPPKVRLEMERELDARFFQARQRSIRVRHVSDDSVIAIIEIVSSGKKRNMRALNDFVDKATIALLEGIHVMIVDLYPPRPLDPGGMHGVIWDSLDGDESTRYVPPPGEPLTLASYASCGGVKAYVEPLAVGATMPDMPLFLTPERYVNVPLEETYMAAYRGVPRRFKQILERT
jgi:hypothetical protein